MPTQNIFDLVDTWASGGGPYTSIKMNATDNDVGSASLLMNLQVGTVSKFSVSKAGSATFGGSITATASGSYVNAAGLSLGTGGAGGIFVSGGNAFTVNSSGGFRWSSNANVNVDTNGDLILTRRGAANLRFGAADAATAQPQILSVQSVVAGTTNTAGANLTITGSQGTGTGAGGSIIFQVAPAGSTGTAQNGLATALTIASNKNATFEGLIFVPDSQGVYASGGSVRFGVSNTTFLFISSSEIRIPNYGIRFGSDGGITNPEFSLLRDTTNTLALRNGTAAQAFNIYNTYTSSTSFERYSVDWITTANLVIVGPNKGSGGGTQRVQRLSYLEDGGAGSTTPSLGTTCPAASATIKSWIKVITSDGTTAYVPCWA